MASETKQAMETAPSASRKRKQKRHSNARKHSKPAPTYQGSKPKATETKKMRRILRRRVREYNSDEEEAEEEPGPASGGEDSEDGADAGTGSSEEEGGVEEGMERGVAKLAEGCRTFKVAFLNIMKLKTPEADPLGPILSAHRKLVVEKLAEEVEDKRAKGEARKERRVAGEKGHVEPLRYLDSKEKLLIGIATKGVVKLFNAVNKAQCSRRSSAASKLKDAKELAKRRKERFMSELRKPANLNKPIEGTDSKEPGWAPLRDDYMLTNSKLKDWDKMESPASTSAIQKPSLDSSSDED